MRRNNWTSVLVVTALFAAVLGCNGQGPGGDGPNSGYAKATVTADLSTPAAVQKSSFAVAFAGTTADVASMTLDVKNGSTFITRGAAFTNTGGIWSATVDGLPIGPHLTFIGHACTVAGAEIFTGTTSQAMTGSNDRVVLMMAPVGGGGTMVFPRITQISRPAEIAAGSAVPVSISVQGSAGETLTFGTTAAANGGAFSPASGRITLNGTTGTVVLGYTAPDGAGTFTHSVKLTNSQGNSVEAAFDANVVLQAAGAEVTVQFLPVITGISAERNGTDVTFAATVSDDGPQGELRYLWSFDNLLSFASATANPAVLTGYDDSVSGTITLTVTDGNGAGGSSTATYLISAGQFPDTVVVDTQPTGTTLPAVLAAGLNGPMGLASDADNVFWFEVGPRAIKRYVLATGTTTTVISGISSSSIFTVDATHVYWKESGNCVLRRVPISGGPVQDVLNSLGNVGNMMVSGTYIYWTETGPGGSIWKISVNGGMETMLASGLNNPQRLVVDGTSVYWTEQVAGGSVKKVGINGGMVTTLAAGLNQPFDIALDGTTLFWTESNAAGSVKKMGIGGGMVTTLASGLNTPTFLAADGANVYWTDSGSRTLKKVATSGGSVATIAAEGTYIYGIVLTQTHVIWETSSSNGAIKSLPK